MSESGRTLYTAHNICSSTGKYKQINTAYNQKYRGHIKNRSDYPTKRVL